MRHNGGQVTSLPTLGEGALQKLVGIHPLEVCVARGKSMNILGLLPDSFEIEIQLDSR